MLPSLPIYNNSNLSTSVLASRGDASRKRSNRTDQPQTQRTSNQVPHSQLGLVQERQLHVAPSAALSRTTAAHLGSPSHKPKAPPHHLQSTSQLVSYSYGSTPISSPGGALPTLAPHQIHYRPANIPGPLPPQVLHSPTVPPQVYHPSPIPGPPQHQYHHHPPYNRPLYVRSPSGNIYSTYPLSPTRARPYQYVYQGD